MSQDKDLKDTLSKIFSNIDTSTLVCLKKKKIFNGDFMQHLKKTNKLIILIQTEEIILNIITVKEDFTTETSKKTLKLIKKGDSNLIIKRIILSPDEKSIAFISKQNIAVCMLSDIELSKEKGKLKKFKFSH